MSAEKGFILPGGENILVFLQLRQVLSTYDGDHRDPLWWPQERPVTMRVARGPLGIPLPSMPGPKSLSGDGYVGELLDLQQGCKDPLEVPEFKCA